MSLSGCHVLLCFWGTPFALKKMNSIAGRGAEGLFRKMTLVFPCPMNKCHFRTGTGGGSRELPGAREIAQRKMTL